MRRTHKSTFSVALLALLALTTGACGGSSDQSSLSESSTAIATERGLSEADVNAALKTYVPSGQADEYIMFASGGHSGQVFVIGMPSMRLIKEVAVFTPEPWQGYGYGDENHADLLAAGAVEIGRASCRERV